MKKLLTILLSVFMIATSLTMNIFANDEPDYFCITNESEENAKVTWIKNGSGSLNLTLEYKKDDEINWTVIEITSGNSGASTDPIILAPNQKVYFKGNSVFNIDKNNHYYVNCNKIFSVSGDITTLVSESGNILDLTDTEPRDKYKYVFTSLFMNATNLTSAKDLKFTSTTLSEYCYYNMFKGCTNLTEAPTLPATQLAKECYRYMFKECTSLETAPALPSTQLAEGCYSDMFDSCTSLKNAPALPAMNLAESCYSSMFSGSGLEIAPELPATTMVDYCYDCMFYKCASLIVAPKLPAMTLAESCYHEMFYNCTSLKAAPVLPATTWIGDWCYGEMFYGCTSLSRIVFYGKTFDIKHYGCTENWVGGVSNTGTFIASSISIPTETQIDAAHYGPSLIPKDENNPWTFATPITVKVNATNGYKVLYSAPKTDGTAEENEKANAQHTVVGIPDGSGNVNYVFGSNETAYIISQPGFIIKEVKVNSISIDPDENDVYSFTPTADCLVEISYKVAKPEKDTTVFVYTGSELTYNVARSDKYTVSGNKQTNVGSYKVTIDLSDGYVWLDGTTDNLVYDFVILPSNPKPNGEITTGAVNTNTKVKDAELKAITKSEAQTIVNTDSTLVNLKQALNDGKNIIIYTEIEEPSNGSKSAFISMNIGETNAVILDINLYGEIVGEPDSKKQITDTNGYKTTVSITLTPEQASKINIANNKNYFILREHNGAIEKIPATLTTDVNGNYVFTFETDKFSAYAIYSENKPAPTPDSKPRYKVPNTGVK